MLLNSTTRVLVVVFVSAVYADMDSGETKRDAKKSFVSLLKNIVEVNQKRVIAMQKLNNLQDFMLNQNTLGRIHDYSFGLGDSAEDLRDQNTVLTLIDRRNLNLTLRRTYKPKEKASNNNINIIIPFNSFNIKSEFKNNENKNDQNDDYNKDNNKLAKYNKITNKIKKYYETESTDQDDKTDYEYFDVQLHKKDNSDEFNYNNEVYDQKNVTSIETDNRTGDITSDEDNTREDGDTIGEDSDNIVDDGDNIGDDDTSFRKNWRGSCDRKAVKVCRSACIDAHRNGCLLYKCSRRSKKAFSKECKRSCIKKFDTGRYSDSDWE